MSAEFDWVVARSKCSIEALFDRLETALNQDRDAIHKIRRTCDDAELSFSCERDRNVITVARMDVSLNETKRKTVKFTMSGTHIKVLQDDKESFRIAPSFSTEGACRMAVNGEELETWQVCRKALEELFFL